MMTRESFRQQRHLSLRFTLTFRLRWIWVGILLYAAFLSQAESISAGVSLAEAPASGIVSPEEWARLCVEGCRAAQTRRDDKFARLTQTLARRAQSSEERSFPNDESRAYGKLLDKERHIHLNQLNYLLFKSKKQVFREVLRHRLPWASDLRPLDGATFGRAIDVLTVGTTPCTLDVLESTLLIAAFGLPFKKQWIDAGVTPAQVFEEVENEYARRARRADRTLEETYVELRPDSPARSKRLIEPLLAKMIASSANGRAFSHDVQRRLVQEVEQFFHLAVEPLRLRLYLNMVIASLETSIGIRISQESADGLQKRIQKRLFDNVQMMGRLADASPEQNVKQIYPLVDDWFQREALPELQKRLFSDPFSAYWFYVQTGMVAQGPFAFRGARLRVDAATADLNMLKGHTMAAALEILSQKKIPTAYVERFREFEKSTTETVMSRSEFLTWVANGGDNSGQRVRLAHILNNAKDRISTLDLLGFFVRDASRFQGAPDTDALIAGLKVLHQAKRERLNREIQNLPQTSDRGRLVTYLRTAGEWMLELEERETREKQFQETIGGGPIGWLLRHTVMANGVPVELWAPGGVTGEAFARLVDEVVATNPESGWSYQGKFGSDVRFIDSGETYHKALVGLINNAKDFLNIQQFDWKLDRGGKEITYRLMAKKLGLTSVEFDALIDEFRGGVLLNTNAKDRTLFFDIPPSKIKNLLFYKLFSSSQRQPINALRERLESMLGGKLDCPSVESCGDLSKIYERAGTRYDKRRRSEPGYQDIWEFFWKLQSLFEEHPLELKDTRPHRWLADYLKDRSRVQCFVRQHGLRRTDVPGQPFEINIVADGKQDLGSLRWFHPSVELPYFCSHPVRDLHSQLLEFNVKLVLWKGIVEYPWHIGPLPIGGRWIGGVFPFPYIPWPWLQFVPGFGWTGMVVQHILATDVRSWWATISHAKSVSNESTTLESGMGFATKYFDIYRGFRSWHDAGVLVHGPVVGDVNDRFVQEFNRARINNRGIPESHGVKIPPLRHKNYTYKGKEGQGSRSWVLTTNSYGRDYDYRGVFMAALAAARDSIYIENPFFSDPLISRMLVRKAREFRGRVDCSGLTELECGAKKRDAVKIYLVVPAATDRPAIDLVGRSSFYEMINEGVKVYRWEPRDGYAAHNMLHTKAWLIDYKPGHPALAYVGSHNADQRSLWADNEMGIVSTSPQLAEALYQGLFLPDLKQDSTPASRSSFEIERLVNPGETVARLLQLVMVDLTWFF